MNDINRRRILQLLGATPAAALALRHADAEAGQHPASHGQAAGAAAKKPAAKKGPFKPQFFTAHEYATVVALADIVLPKDERSGSASDAGVPEFIDFIVNEQPTRHAPVRGGLQWLDTECRRRFSKDFVKCADAERTQVLDDIAYPAKAKPQFSHGVAFFNQFRDLCATGFFTSKLGMEDLKYTGNTFVAEWTGSPPEVMKKLGVSY